MNATAAASKQNQSVNALKGIAILFVIITHFDNYSDGTSLKLLFPFYISMAVPIFMALSGYVNTCSFLARGYSIRNYWSIKLLGKRIIRYTMPYLIYFIIERFIHYFQAGTGASLKILLFQFIKGGVGKGSYYYPVMIQFIFLFPLIYHVTKKWKWKGVALCFFINLAFEAAQTILGLGDEIYRLLFFRYIFVVSLGCIAGIEKMKPKAAWFGILFVGFLYILLIRYLNVSPIVTKKWSGTSMWACMFAAPIVLFISVRNSFKCKLLEYIGKASYHIMYAQMFYYLLLAPFVYGLLSNTILQLILGIIICVSLGIGFYIAETPLSKRVIRLFE